MKTIELTDEEAKFLSADMQEIAYHAERNLKEYVRVGYGFEPDLSNDSMGFYFEQKLRLSKSILEKL